MIKINTKIELKNFKGDALKDSSNEVFTTGNVLTNILSGSRENPYRSYILAKKFATDDEVELKSEDVLFLKKCIESNILFTALITGQIIELLEQ